MLLVLTDLTDVAAPPDTTLDARTYLEDAPPSRSGTRLVNLCRSWEYPSEGYYVSLLADARGHRPIPTIDVMRSMESPDTVIRGLLAAGVPTDTDTREPAGAAQLLVCLGRASDPSLQRLASQVFRVWPVPLLRVDVVCVDESWRVRAVRPESIGKLDDAEHQLLDDALARYSQARSPRPHEAPRAQIAVLHDPAGIQNPSTVETIERLIRVGRRMGVHVQPIGTHEIDRVADFDALFVRALTGIGGPAFMFAQRAEALGMPVLDDTHSILRCCNKVFCHELLRREGIPTPKTLTAGRSTKFSALEAELGLPFILKLPDGSFSNAVYRITGEPDYAERSALLFESAPLLIAQAYTPTAFDWRVTVLGGEPLFVCKYHMAKGDWRIVSPTATGHRFGKVEAIPRRSAPPDLLRVAIAAASKIGDGLYGVDIKETPRGFVVIEVNDNPNIDVGYDDAAEGDAVYEAILNHFLKRIAAGHQNTPRPRRPVRHVPDDLEALRAPIGKVRERETPYKAYEVCGLELEYVVVDRDLNARSLVAPVLALLAGRPVSDVSLGVVGLSNEITDHVFEIKTEVPLRSLVQSEELLVEGIRRVAALLESRYDARLLPTGMHPWFDPKRARIWQRSNRRIYQTYTRLFDLQTHGWANVQATHVNLPLGEEPDAVAMMNAAVLLVPYLPAIAASTPMFSGELQPSVDNRLAFILEHQVRLPESCGQLLPEYITSIAGYKRDVLGPMYKAVDNLDDASALRREFLNARAAVFKLSRQSMEVRVLDVQECVKMDAAIAAFTRASLKSLAGDLKKDKLDLPDWDLLLEDFFAAIRHGTRARVHAPHLAVNEHRGDDGKVPIRVALDRLLVRARRSMRSDEGPYMDLVARVAAEGNLSEAITRALEPRVDDDDAFTEAARRVYVELSHCLVDNEPWKGRWTTGPA